MEYSLVRNTLDTRKYKSVNDLLDNYPELQNQKDHLIEAIELMIKSYSSGNKLLIAGNGGSASDADHIVGELMKSFVKRRELSTELKTKISIYKTKWTDDLINHLQMPLRAISLNAPTSLMTAFSNDVEPKYAVSQTLLGYGDKGDIFLAISTSGNSENICAAAQVAKALGLYVIAMTGKNDSLLSNLADVTLRSPSTETYRIQEFHLPMYHTLCLEIESYFFEK